MGEWAFNSVSMIPVPVCFIPLLCCSREGGPQLLQPCKVEVRTPTSQGVAGFPGQWELNNSSQVAEGRRVPAQRIRHLHRPLSRAQSTSSVSFPLLVFLSLGFSLLANG